MRGITIKVVAAAAVGVLVTAAPMVWVGAMPSALGAAGPHHPVNGTTGNDHLIGSVGADLIAGRSGADTIRPNRGADLIRAAAGDDRIFLFNDGDVDRVHCGAGFDVVAYDFSVDQHDIIDSNCEARIA
jgi:Ca2+-binding RTX toxin-like protein